jgi:hypothetical protein
MGSSSADAGENAPLPNGSQLTIRRNVFVQTTGAQEFPLYIYWNEDPAVAAVVRIVDNCCTTIPARRHFRCSRDLCLRFVRPADDRADQQHVVNNGGSLGGFGLLNFASVPVYAYNNVFYGNTATTSPSTYGTNITLVDNVIGTHSWSGTTQNSGTTTGDPKLDPSTVPADRIADVERDQQRHSQRRRRIAGNRPVRRAPPDRFPRRIAARSNRRSTTWPIPLL